MAEKKSAYEMMMERARAGAKGKGGRPPASSSLKAKEAAVTLARKEEEAAAAAAKDSSTEAGKTAAGIVVLSVADRVALLSKKETEFDPQMAAFWKPGEHVPFTFLASAFDSKLFSSVVEAFPLLSISLYSPFFSLHCC
jgi:DNA ligase-1